VTILAIDTTSELGSIAVRKNGETVIDRPLHSPDGFAHTIFQAIDRLLRDAGVPLNEIDCFAAASGPGSFTGLRVGLSAVKGLAEATGKRVAGVSNLRAMASFGNGPVRAVILDARRDEVFVAVYDAELRSIETETVSKLAAWLDTLSLPEYEFVVAEGAPFRELLEGTRFTGMPYVEAAASLADAVARCAQIDGELGRWLDPASLDANYVRRSDAELFWKDR